jgi:hypothetical protein
MKFVALVCALVATVLFTPAAAVAHPVAASPHAHPQGSCPAKQIFRQPVNFYHETMYAAIYELQSGMPCTPSGSYYAQGQVDFSGSGSHVGTIYAELLAGPPYLYVEYKTITYSPTTNVVNTPATSSFSGCGLKAYVSFDQNGLSFMSTDFVGFC